MAAIGRARKFKGGVRGQAKKQEEIQREGRLPGSRRA